MANETCYTAGVGQLLNGTATFTGSTIGVLGLGTLPTTPSQGYAKNVLTIAALLALPGCAEASGTGYARKTLASKTVTPDNTNFWVALNGASIAYTSATGWTLRALVVYVDVGGTDATRYPLAYYDQGLPVTATGATVTYTWNATGLITASE